MSPLASLTSGPAAEFRGASDRSSKARDFWNRGRIALMLVRCVCCVMIGVSAVTAVTAAGQERIRSLPTPRRPTTAPLAPKFIVGVYMQPTDTFDVWRTRGVNTLVGYESRGGAIANK